MNVTRATLAAVLLAHHAPFAYAQAVAWKEVRDQQNWPDCSVRHSLFESPTRDTLSCSILITRDGSTMYISARDPNYVFPNVPDKAVWEMVQRIQFTKKPDGTVDFKVGWGTSRMGGLVGPLGAERTY